MKTNGQYQSKNWNNYRGECFTVTLDTGRKTANGSHIWLATCDCGKTFEVASGRISRTKSCGCMNKAVKIDWTGKSVRGFTAIKKTEKVSNGYSVWEARCNYCGKVKEFPSYYFKRGHCSCECEGWQQEYADKIGRKPLPNHQSHVNIIYNHYKRSAKERNLSFDLTKGQVRKLIEQDCCYCGQKPIARYTAIGCAGEYEWNGIDRVDNTKGYTVDNCVPCCKLCNFGKRDLTIAEFSSWIERTYHMMKSKGVVK